MKRVRVPRHIIYGLFDPTDTKLLALPDPNRKVRYVGFTVKKTIEQKVTEHIVNTRSVYKREKRKTHKHKWINSLLKREVAPCIMVLEVIRNVKVKQDWVQREQYWISYLRGLGNKLVNSTAGGEGLIDPSPEVRAAIASKCGRAGNQNRKGIPHTASDRKAISDGMKSSEKYQRALSEGRVGWKLGQTHSEETKQLISRQKTGVSRPDMVARTIEFNRRRRGCRWINDGNRNQQLLPGNSLPNGWYFGRLMPWQS